MSDASQAGADHFGGPDRSPVADAASYGPGLGQEEDTRNTGQPHRPQLGGAAQSDKGPRYPHSQGTQGAQTPQGTHALEAGAACARQAAALAFLLFVVAAA